MRTDIHSPTNINVENYTLGEWFDSHPPEYYPGMSAEAYNAEVRAHHAQMEAIRLLKASTGTPVYRSIARCDHCGATFRYGVVARHVSGQAITIGTTCAAERFDISQILFQLKQHKAKLAARAARRGRRAKLVNWGREHRDVLRALVSVRRTPRVPEFLHDLRGQLIENGELSDAQCEAAIRVAAEHLARVAARKASDAAAPAPSPVPAGKTLVTGEVLGTRVQDGAYGREYKLLVRDDRGFKIWSTCPRPIVQEIGYGQFDQLRGRRVAFCAVLEPSRDDPTFGFARRPSRPVLFPAQ